MDLNTHLYNSYDGISRFIFDITNGGVTLSKGTLHLWNELVSDNLKIEIENIEKKLLESYFIRWDEL